MQTVYFFFDDSGVLHKKEESHYFVYAGYVFTSRDELNSARREYKKANSDLKTALGRNDELKASNLEAKHKRSLFNSVRKYESISAAVHIPKVYDRILSNKKSICRYKDFVLKMCVKEMIVSFINKNILSADDDITIDISIDEQTTSTDGRYSLKDSIFEEFKYGIINFNYSMIHTPLFNKEVIVNVRFCDSKQNYMIQAADILANRIWTSYFKNNHQLRNITNHKNLTFP